MDKPEWISMSHETWLKVRKQPDLLPEAWFGADVLLSSLLPPDTIYPVDDPEAWAEHLREAARALDINVDGEPLVIPGLDGEGDSS